MFGQLTPNEVYYGLPIPVTQADCIARLEMVETIPDRRAAPRFRGQIPVELGYGDNRYEGMTRDFSSSGIYFETLTDPSVSPAQLIEFALPLEHFRPGQLVRLRCSGEVVRVKENARKGVAVAIRSHWFQGIQENGTK